MTLGTNIPAAIGPVSSGPQSSTRLTGLGSPLSAGKAEFSSLHSDTYYLPEKSFLIQSPKPYSQWATGTKPVPVAEAHWTPLPAPPGQVIAILEDRFL